MNITEFAKCISLSKGTVSRALNDRPEVSAKTRRYVLERAEALGFSRNPNARRLATGRTHLIQLECPYNTRVLSDQYLVELARGLEDTASEHGLDLMLHLGANYRSTTDVPAVDGLIIVAGAETSPTDIRTLTAYGHTPAVIISDTAPVNLEPHTSYVHVDNQFGVREALDKIVVLGHTRLGYIGSDHAMDSIRRLIEKAGLQWNPALAIQAGVTLRQGFDAALRLLDQPCELRPTVILTRTDILAAGAVQAANRLDLNVPADISIVGHDDIDLAMLVNPPLTTVAINIPKIALTVMELLTGMIEDQNEPSVSTLGSHLIMRGSLGPPAH
jgi:LacI family transcriptional regulator